MNKLTEKSKKERDNDSKHKSKDKIEVHSIKKNYQVDIVEEEKES